MVLMANVFSIKNMLWVGGFKFVFFLVESGVESVCRRGPENVRAILRNLGAIFTAINYKVVSSKNSHKMRL